MKEIRFLHCVDMRLGFGHKVSGFADARRLNIRREDLSKTFQKILDTAKTDGSDFIIFSGAFLDTDHINEATLNFVKSELQKCSDDTEGKIRFIIAPRNDGTGISKSDNEIYSKLSDCPCVTVVNSPHTKIHLDDIGTCVYNVTKETTDIIAEIKNEYPSSFRVAICQGSIEKETAETLARNIVLNTNAISEKYFNDQIMHYVACEFSKNRLHNIYEKNVLFCPGTPEPLTEKETGPHGIYCVHLAMNNSVIEKEEVTFIETALREFINARIDISGCFSQEAISEKIISEFAPNPNQIFNISLEGEVSPFLTFIADELTRMTEGVFFDLIIDTTGVNQFDIAAMAESPGIKGLYIKKLLSEIEEAPDDREKQIMQQALFFGIMALEGKKICL